MGGMIYNFFHDVIIGSISEYKKIKAMIEVTHEFIEMIENQNYDYEVRIEQKKVLKNVIENIDLFKELSDSSKKIYLDTTKDLWVR